MLTSLVCSLWSQVRPLKVVSEMRTGVRVIFKGSGAREDL